jgi:hypothetical protein
MDSLNEKIVNMQNNIVGAVERKPHMVRTVSFGRDMVKML